MVCSNSLVNILPLPLSLQSHFFVFAPLQTTLVVFWCYFNVKLIILPIFSNCNSFHKLFLQNNKIFSAFPYIFHAFSPIEANLMSNRAVTDSIEVLMKKYMENYIADLSKKKGEMPVTVNNIIIGKGTPNEQMKKEMDRTAAMIQERKSQEQRQATEKAREAAERQRARADRAYMAELNLTTQDFINLKWIQTISEKQGANIDVMVGPATSMWNVRR
jgi:hypothetical protein